MKAKVDAVLIMITWHNIMLYFAKCKQCKCIVCNQKETNKLYSNANITINLDCHTEQEAKIRGKCMIDCILATMKQHNTIWLSLQNGERYSIN